jgi:hypothetical protein
MKKALLCSLNFNIFQNITFYKYLKTQPFATSKWVGQGWYKGCKEPPFYVPYIPSFKWVLEINAYLARWGIEN